MNIEHQNLHAKYLDPMKISVSSNMGKIKVEFGYICGYIYIYFKNR